MSKIESAGSEPLPSNDNYLYDGYIRRIPHEYDVTDFGFYDRFLEVMDFQPGQMVADIGAGMGHDAFKIAATYGPRYTFLIEPRLSDPGFMDRYLPMEDIIQKTAADGVQLLPLIPEKEASKRLAWLAEPGDPALNQSVPRIQPVESRAEQLPFPDNSIDREVAIHSIYAVGDVDAMLREIARTLKPDGTGGLITNGPGDKQLVKQKLQEMKSALESDAPEGVEYKIPSTVSSKFDYYAARDALKQYFNKVILFTYQGRMEINSDRKPIYNWGFDSYRKLSMPPIINFGRWVRARNEIYGWPTEDDPAYNDHIAYDTIDIGWLIFSEPKK